MVDTGVITAVPLWRPGPAEAGREAILHAAADQFVKYGFAATSIDAIADALGSTKGRVYHYYRSKAEVFLDVVVHGMQDLMSMIKPLATAEGQSAWDRMSSIARSHALCMMEEANPQRIAVQMVQFRRMPEFAMHQETVHEIIRLRRRYEQYVVEIIEEGMATGEFRQEDASLLAKSILGSLNWIPMWFSPGRTTPEEVERIATFFTENTLGVLAPKGN